MKTPSEVPSAPTVILPNYSVEQMKLAQEKDAVIKQIQECADSLFVLTLLMRLL